MNLRTLCLPAVLALSFVRPAAGADDPLITNPPLAVEPAFFDKNVKPGDDFFRYANGGWTKSATIPGDRATWGVAEELQERNEVTLHAILDECAAQTTKGEAAPGTPRQKVGDLFRGGMDEAAVNAVGTAPLAPWFDAIHGLSDRNGLPALLATLHGAGWSSAFLVTGYQDERDATAQLALLYQGGLGLPNKEYYTKDDEKSRDLRAQYERHVAIMLLLNGASPEQAARDAATVLRFETRLAEASRTPVELRDPESNYHKLTLTENTKQYHSFDSQSY